MKYFLIEQDGDNYTVNQLAQNGGDIFEEWCSLDNVGIKSIPILSNTYNTARILNNALIELSDIWTEQQVLDNIDAVKVVYSP